MSKHVWTSEGVAALDTIRLRSLRDNALRLKADDLLTLCDAELANRVPVKVGKPTIAGKASHGDFVAGYHFVCSGSRGVIDDNDGTFWTGSWVVARQNVEVSMQHGAYVALHENKNEPSYLQGEILEFRLRERDMVYKENVGIEFRCKKSVQSKMWAGGGSGEKGYLWGAISSLKNPNQA